jgi:hypothetical protein
MFIGLVIIFGIPGFIIYYIYKGSIRTQINDVSEYEQIGNETPE